VAADRIDIKVTADTREASASLARFAERARETAQSVGRIGTGVTAGLATIGAGAVGVARATAAFEAHERAATMLGDAYDQVRVATLGTVSAQQALQTQQGLVQSGLQVSGQQLATITRAARDYALATGTETTQALGTLSDALRGMEAEGLRRFNISVSQSGDRTRDFNAALEQLAQRQSSTQMAARTMAEDIDAATSAMGRFAGSIAASISRALELQQAFQWASNLLDPEFQRRETQGTTLLARAGVRAELRGRAMQALGQAEQAGLDVRQLRQVMGTRGITEDDLSRITGFAQESARATVRGGAGSVRLNQQVLEQAITPAMREAMQLVQSTAAAQAESRRKARENEEAQKRLRDAAHGAAGALNRATDAASVFARVNQRISERMTRAQGRSFAGLAGISGQSPEEFSDLLGGLAAPSESELSAQESQRGKLEAAFGMQRGARARERGASFGGRFAAALGIELDESGNVPALDVAQAGVDMLATSLSSLTSGFSNLFNTLASGSMSAGEAFQQFAAKTLSSLGEMAVNKGVFYTFEGIASLFTNPVAAPGYLAAGAGLIALGVGLGAAGSAVAPSAAPGGSSAPAAARSASGASPRSDGGGAGNVTIVLSSLVPPGPRELQGLVNAQRQATRYGIDRDRMVPRQVRA
jgi:hypothetical protein